MPLPRGLGRGLLPGLLSGKATRRAPAVPGRLAAVPGLLLLPQGDAGRLLL